MNADSVVFFSRVGNNLQKNMAMAAFRKNEISNADVPLSKGPFYKMIKVMTTINRLFPDAPPIFNMLVTARGEESSPRVFNTFNHWNVELQGISLYGWPKKSTCLV